MTSLAVFSIASPLKQHNLACTLIYNVLLSTNLIHHSISSLCPMQLVVLRDTAASGFQGSDVDTILFLQGLTTVSWCVCCACKTADGGTQPSVWPPDEPGGHQHWQPHRVAEPSFTNLCCCTCFSNADGGPQPAVRPPDEPGSHQHQRPCTSTRLQLVQRERNKGGENKASGAAAVRHGWCGVAWCPALPLLLQNSTDTTKEGRSETCTQQASVTAAAHQKLTALLA